MAFNINPGKQQFSATAAQTVFTFNFAIFADTDLKVYKTLAGAVADDTADILILSTHYTVSINGTLGGTVTLLSGASLNDTITIVRVLPITRSTDYVTNGDLYADTLDLDQDYQTYLTADADVQLQRAIIVPESLSGVSLSIPAPVSNSYLRWNATANALENDTTIPTAVVTTNNNVILTNADVVLTHADVVLTHADVVLANNWAEAAATSAATLTPVNEQINSAIEKTTPVDSDLFGIVDSAASNALKKLSWLNVKATLKTYFDTLYSVIGSGGSKIQPITASVATNALTVTLNATSLDFRSATLGDGTVNTRTIASPISMTISSGSTLGTINAVQARLVLIAIDNAGTVELAIVNSEGGNNIDETSLITTTAEGGAGAADSASIIYSTTARTNVPFRVVGFIDITEATAGTWATQPSEIQGAGGQSIISIITRKLFNIIGNAPMFAPRAWVNFNGTGTVAIRASGNISSITDNGTGDYTANIATALPDANYGANISGGSQTSGGTRVFMEQHDVVVRTTTALRIYTLNSSYAPADTAVVSISIFR